VKDGKELGGDDKVIETDPVTSKGETGCDEGSQNSISENLGYGEIGSDQVQVTPSDMPALKGPSDMPALKVKDTIRYKLDENSSWQTATVLGRAGKATGQYKSHYNIRDIDSGEMKYVDLNSVKDWVKCTDDEVTMDEEVNVVLVPRARHQDKQCVEARRVELEKLKHYGVYREVEDKGQNCLSTRWVLWWKGTEVRARLVVRGFEEEEELNKDSPTVVKSTMRVLMAIAAWRKWPIKTRDIKSAFLQGKDIDREVFVLPPPEAQDKNKWMIWQLKKSLYGLNDAARQFYDSVEAELVRLGAKRSQVDPALFYVEQDGEIIGALATHIDDFMHCGNAAFDVEVMDKLRKRFVPGKLEEGSFSYVGFDIKQSKNGIMLDQSHYMQDLQTVNILPQRSQGKKDELSHSEHKDFRGLVGRCN
jgi:hypothetical protein